MVKQQLNIIAKHNFALIFDCFRLIFIDFHWFPLIFIDFHWFPLISVDFHSGFNNVPNVHTLYQTYFCDNIRRPPNKLSFHVPTVPTCSNIRKSTEINKKQWKSMKIIENQWKSMKISRTQSPSVEINWFSRLGLPRLG